MHPSGLHIKRRGAQAVPNCWEIGGSTFGPTWVSGSALGRSKNGKQNIFANDHRPIFKLESDTAPVDAHSEFAFGNLMGTSSGQLACCRPWDGRKPYPKKHFLNLAFLMRSHPVWQSTFNNRLPGHDWKHFGLIKTISRNRSLRFTKKLGKQQKRKTAKQNYDFAGKWLCKKIALRKIGFAKN